MHRSPGCEARPIAGARGRMVRLGHRIVCAFPNIGAPGKGQGRCIGARKVRRRMDHSASRRYGAALPRRAGVASLGLVDRCTPAARRHLHPQPMAASADMAVAVAKNVLERLMAALLTGGFWNGLSAKPNAVERRSASRPWATDKEPFAGRTKALIARQLLGHAYHLVTDPGLEDGQARCQEAAGGQRQELAGTTRSRGSPTAAVGQHGDHGSAPVSDDLHGAIQRVARDK